MEDKKFFLPFVQEFYHNSSFGWILGKRVRTTYSSTRTSPTPFRPLVLQILSPISMLLTDRK